MAKEFYTTGTGSNQALHSSQNEKIPIYDTVADAEADLSNLEEGMLIGTKDLDTVSNCPFPVGSVYTQYPQCDAPADLWFGTTWTELNFSGAFFRANGGNADSYIDETGTLAPQGDMVKSHTHDWSNTHNHGITDPGHKHFITGSKTTALSNWLDNYFTAGSSTNVGAQGANSVGNTTGITINNTTISGTTSSNNTSNIENRPVNYTIKIWKRTA